MEYWIIIDNEQRGPMDIEELKQLPLSPDTPVWAKGMDDWTTVAAVPELARLLIPRACPAPPVSHGSKQPPSYMWQAILFTVIGNILFGIISIFFSWKVKSHRKKGDFFRAYRASERTALFIILNIVFSLISIPFAIVFGMGGFSLL